jgi:hypothetical protein
MPEMLQAIAGRRRNIFAAVHTANAQWFQVHFCNLPAFSE